MTADGIAIPTVPVGRRTVTTARPRISQRHALPPFALDGGAMVIAGLDVWLATPADPPNYSIVACIAACLSLAVHRRFPFAVTLATVPGFLVGWSQLAAMFALGLLAARCSRRWHLLAGAALIWACRFVRWPLSEFIGLSWRQHLLNGLYGLLVTGMPVAVGLLVAARTELTRRLATVPTNDYQSYADAARADERAKLAREMHDVVSHDVTLIALQANALAASTQGSDKTRDAARTIKQLSTRTLDELRALVGILRARGGEQTDPGIEQLPALIKLVDVPTQLSVASLPDQVPAQVSAAVYRNVQECLTNAHKHAPGAAATVRVRGEENAVVVEVSNKRPTKTPEPLPSGGHGLTGLAERTRLLGGDFTTARTSDGGFRVHTRYPL